MKPFVDALRNSGLSPTEIAHVTSFPGRLVALWRESRDPILMMRIASAVGADPRVSVAIAVEGATAVLKYVGSSEPRPARAIAAAEAWLRGEASAKDCELAAQRAESVSVAYRDEKRASAIERRTYRAASHAALAAAKAALVARDAAVTTELEYDTEYTFEDAWDGARVSCALGAGQALVEGVEASVSAISANTAIETGTPMLGIAAADEARPGALLWAANIVRSHLSAQTLRLAEIEF